MSIAAVGMWVRGLCAYAVKGAASLLLAVFTFAFTLFPLAHSGAGGASTLLYLRLFLDFNSFFFF
jgi:hypothetical protein